MGRGLQSWVLASCSTSRMEEARALSVTPVNVPTQGHAQPWGHLLLGNRPRGDEELHGSTFLLLEPA